MDAIARLRKELDAAETACLNRDENECLAAIQDALAALNALGDCVVVPRVEYDDMLKAAAYRKFRSKIAAAERNEI